MSERLAGKAAIVTGGSKGIGAAIVRRFAAEGADVLIASKDQSSAEALAAEVSASGGSVACFEVDVRDKPAIDAAVESAINAFGKIDILVNNAGIMERAPFLEMTGDFFRNVHEVNLIGTFHFSQSVARQMIKQGTGGRIVNVASNSGIFGGRGRAAYGSSKAGMINLTQTMAIELAEHDIIVNAVAPGPTKSGDHVPEQLAPSIASRMPLNRVGRVEEVAAAALFLASDECSFTTGHVLGADGGLTVAGFMEG